MAMVKGEGAGTRLTVIRFKAETAAPPPERRALFGRRRMPRIHELPLRVSEGNDHLKMAIREAIAHKPKGYDFILDRTSRQPAVARHMGGDRGLTQTMRDSMSASSPEQILTRVATNS